MRLEIETVGVPVCPHAPEAPMSAAAAWRRFQRASPNGSRPAINGRAFAMSGLHNFKIPRADQQASRSNEPRQPPIENLRQLIRDREGASTLVAA
jgi:hypothetical protein